MENIQEISYFAKIHGNEIWFEFTDSKHGETMYDDGWVELSEEEYNILHDGDDHEEYNKILRFVEKNSIQPIEVSTYSESKIHRILRSVGADWVSFSVTAKRNYQYSILPKTRESEKVIIEILCTDFRKVKLKDFKI